MKKIVILALFLSGYALSYAQSNPVRFGLQLSPTFSWLDSNDSEISRNGTSLGIKLAMIGEYAFQENYSITSGLGFAFNHGGTLSYETEQDYWVEGQSKNDLKYSVQYVEVPLGLKMRTREFGYLRYYGEPYMMLSFRSQARGDIKDTDFNDIDIKEFVTPLGLSWGIGGGVEYGLSASTALIGGIYYQNTFTDLTKDVALGDNSKTPSQAITIRLGIIF